jgi:hypothetical protein
MEDDDFEVDLQSQEVLTAPAVPDLLQNINISSLRERIVELMPGYPCLWCTNLRSYKDLTKKSAAIRELSSKLNAPGKI